MSASLLLLALCRKDLAYIHFEKQGGTMYKRQIKQLLSQLLNECFVFQIPLIFFVIAHASLGFSQTSERTDFKTLGYF